MINTLRAAVFGAATVLTLACVSAQAATIVLTFEGFACRAGGSYGPTDSNCTASGQLVGSDYGTTTGLTVLFANNSQPTPQRVNNFQVSSNFGVSEVGNGLAAPSQIFFTPDSGYEVSFVSYVRRSGSATANSGFFRLLDPNGTEVYSLDANNTTNTVETVNSAFFSGPITFRYGSITGGTVVDDITLELRQISTTGTTTGTTTGATTGSTTGGGSEVPEPSTWGILSLGLAGLLATRRRA